jgi:hypothetical protein
VTLINLINLIVLVGLIQVFNLIKALVLANYSRLVYWCFGLSTTLVTEKPFGLIN